MPKIYLVSLRWIDTEQNPEMIDATLMKYGDWLRWNGWTWFLATNFAASSIRIAVMERLKNTDSLIISEITPSSLEGWAPKSVWDWFNSRWYPNSNPTTIPPSPGTLGDLFISKRPWET